jgi:hypothetical protein
VIIPPVPVAVVRLRKEAGCCHGAYFFAAPPSDIIFGHQRFLIKTDRHLHLTLRFSPGCAELLDLSAVKAIIIGITAYFGIKEAGVVVNIDF